MANRYQQILGGVLGVLVGLSIFSSTSHPAHALQAMIDADSAFDAILDAYEAVNNAVSATTTSPVGTTTILAAQEDLLSALQSYVEGDYQTAADTANDALAGVASSTPLHTLSEARQKINDVRARLEDIADEIDDADEEGDDVTRARILLRSAESKISDAEIALSAEHSDEAYTLANDAFLAGRDAHDAIPSSTRDQAETRALLNDYEEVFDAVKEEVEEVASSGGSLGDARSLVQDAKEYLEEADEELDKGHLLRANKMIDKADTTLNKIYEEMNWRVLL